VHATCPLGLRFFLRRWITSRTFLLVYALDYGLWRTVDAPCTVVFSFTECSIPDSLVFPLSTLRFFNLQINEVSSVSWSCAVHLAVRVLIASTGCHKSAYDCSFVSSPTSSTLSRSNFTILSHHRNSIWITLNR
jgi:hypothetical protein